MNGYEKFKQAGAALKGQPIQKRQYEDLPTTELEAKKTTAENWLRENKESTNYAEALRRYEAICDELQYRQAKEILL